VHVGVGKQADARGLTQMGNMGLLRRHHLHPLLHAQRHRMR